LANIKSQIKRNRQNQKRRLRNRAYRGAARGAVLEARSALEAGEPSSREAVLRAVSLLDKAAERGVVHPNNAARRKGRLLARLAKFGAAGPSLDAATAVQSPEASSTEVTQKAAGAKKPAARKPSTKKTTRKSTAK